MSPETPENVLANLLRVYPLLRFSWQPPHWLDIGTHRRPSTEKPVNRRWGSKLWQRFAKFGPKQMRALDRTSGFDITRNKWIFIFCFIPLILSSLCTLNIPYALF